MSTVGLQRIDFVGQSLKKKKKKKKSGTIKPRQSMEPIKVGDEK